ncbi:MAG: hypothetical protein ACI4DV_01150 [Lachnospiraceae bacterium]
MKQVYLHLGLGVFWLLVAIWMGMTNGFDISVLIIGIVACVFFAAAYKALINPNQTHSSENLIQKCTKKRK